MTELIHLCAYAPLALILVYTFNWQSPTFRATSWSLGFLLGVPLFGLFLTIIFRLVPALPPVQFSIWTLAVLSLVAFGMVALHALWHRKHVPPDAPALLEALPRSSQILCLIMLAYLAWIALRAWILASGQTGTEETWHLYSAAARTWFLGDRVNLHQLGNWFGGQVTSVPALLGLWGSAWQGIWNEVESKLWITLLMGVAVVFAAARLREIGVVVPAACGFGVLLVTLPGVPQAAIRADLPVLIGFYALAATLGLIYAAQLRELGRDFRSQARSVWALVALAACAAVFSALGVGFVLSLLPAILALVLPKLRKPILTSVSVLGPVTLLLLAQSHQFVSAASSAFSTYTPSRVSGAVSNFDPSRLDQLGGLLSRSAWLLWVGLFSFVIVVLRRQTHRGPAGIAAIFLVIWIVYVLGCFLFPSWVVAYGLLPLTESQVALLVALPLLGWSSVVAYQAHQAASGYELAPERAVARPISARAPLSAPTSAPSQPNSLPDVDPRPMLEQGLALQKAGQLESARKLFETVLRVDPQHPDAHHLLGLMALNQNRLEDAERLIREAIRVFPEHGLFHQSLADALSRQERFGAAEEALLEAIRLDPTNTLAKTRLVLVRRRRLMLEAQTKQSQATSATRGSYELIVEKPGLGPPRP